MTISNPETCEVGKTYFYDPSTTFNAFWTQSGGNDTMVVRAGAYATSTYVTPQAVVTANATIVSGAVDFDSIELTYSVIRKQRPFISGSSNPCFVRIQSGITVELDFGANNEETCVIKDRFNNVMYINSIPSGAPGGFATFTFTDERAIKIVQASPGVFTVFLEGVEVLSAHDSTITGPRVITLEASFYNNLYTTGQDFDSGGDGNAAEQSWKNIYIIGAGLPSACLGVPVGIAHGFGGWISVFEDDSLTGNSPTLPQAIVVDQDNLRIGKEILIK